MRAVRAGARQSRQCRALPEETPVHDREDTRLHRARGRALINDALLQPQRRQLQTNARLDDARDVLAAAEDIDDVDPLVGRQRLRQLIERGDRRLTEDGFGERVHRDDPVAEALQGLRHAVTRPRPVWRESDDGDGARGAQELRDALGRRVHEHDGSMALAFVDG